MAKKPSTKSVPTSPKQGKPMQAPAKPMKPPMKRGM